MADCNFNQIALFYKGREQRKQTGAKKMNGINQGSIWTFNSLAFSVQLRSGEWQWYNTSKDGKTAYIRKLGKKGQPLSCNNLANVTSIIIEALYCGEFNGSAQCIVG